MLNLKKDQILLSRFCLRELIGRGGMGQVWLVWDRELEIEIAAKILNPQLTSDPHRVRLLKNECRNTRRLAHPNIVRVFDFHRSEEFAFISMEYVNGQNLNDYRHRLERVSTLQVVKLLKPVVNALGYAHEMGLVHRDVKAGNILIDRQQIPRLTDFGIAGVFKSGQQALKITSGGSLFCMSPQQLDNQEPSPQDDIYALGVLLYQMFTGYPPFYPDITRDRIRHEPPVAVNQRLGQLAIDAAVPDTMEHLISGMLAKTPADRPARMGEIEALFEGLLGKGIEPIQPPDIQPEVISARPPTPERTEIIAPVSVASSKPLSQLQVYRGGNLAKGMTLLAVLVLLLAGGFWLWHYLGGEQERPPEQQAPAGELKAQKQPEKNSAPAERAPQTTTDPARLAAEKLEADKNLGEFMQLKQELETRGVSQWGAEIYQQMSVLADEADRLLIENSYAAAAEKYAAAAAKAKTLAEQMQPVLKRLLAEGQVALEEGKGQLAEEKFKVALLIDPANRTAQENLQRAQNTDALMALLASGERHENEGDLTAAHKDYQEAVRLDPASQKARQALARVDATIRKLNYQGLMSEGLTALHNKKYQLARKKLQKAQTIRPDSREAREALVQVDQFLRLSRIETYRSQAVVAEESENWQQALNAYQRALQIDSNVQFAVEGKQRALKHIRIEKRLIFFLQQPSALESDNQLKNALDLMAEVKSLDMKTTGPRLKAQFDKFERIVIAAQTPIKIILESDTFTEVAVYKIGRLGRFDSRELNLRPGSYTVVGTRDGYQDVRKKIIVKPEQGPIRVTIRCEVKI